MVRFTGQIFGFNYDIEKASNEEFASWLIGKLKARIPVEVWVMLVTKLLQQSDEYNLAKTKLADHETRIRALEAK